EGIDYTYDPSGRVSTIVAWQEEHNGRKEVLASYGYLYDNAGRRNWEVREDGTLYHYTYDGAGRLDSAYYPFEDANATDMLGRQIPDEAIRWSMSRDGETWKPYEVEEEGCCRVPETPGALYLLGTIEETAGRTRDERFTFEVTEEYTPVRFDIGPELSGPVEEHPDGKTYGFTTDHSDRAGSFTAKTIIPRFRRRPIVITTEETFVALKQGEAFRYVSGNGRYKVILRLGPIGPIRHHTVAIEDREINIPRAFWGLDIFTVTTEIEVTDGILEIRGTRGLTIMSLEVHRLTGEDPPVEETVERQENTVIILHPRECGWRGGSLWEDLEAWINNDTPNGKWDW
ncbi:MAG: hypothetical protein KAU17_02125, partial [Spirochaetales bacterium]|nr:hypothetical protein [Spirochaetales bacterium]